jgi:hypothetical protein
MCMWRAAPREGGAPASEQSAGACLTRRRLRRLDGSMSVPQRADELGRFRADAAVPAMLFSLLAGSTGLNLTARPPLLRRASTGK